MAHPYRGQNVALATKHEKQRAIAPPLAATPGLRVQLAAVDTDELGTFSGEIERRGTARETVLAKARLGIAATGIPRGLASEGSFGPHPGAFMIPAGHELLAFVDQQRGIEVIEQRLCLHTNYAQTTARNTAGLGDFLHAVRFPAHALVVRPNAGPIAPLTKGLITLAQLDGAIRRAARASPDGLAHIETDMRAHHNPTRHRQLALLARQLARRLTAQCPACQTPGWGVTEVERGLPCEWCHQPTELVALEVRSCPSCPHQERSPRPDGLQYADPGRCAHCNP